jgi:tetratricopeptide (TPR) repeat protein
MEWLLALFFVPYVATLLFFNWVEKKLSGRIIPESFEKGEDLINEKKYEEALEYFTEKITKSPKSAKLYRFRGKCHLGLNNFFSAIYDFEQSLIFDNTIPETYFLKGKALYKIQEYDKAFLEFDKSDWHFRGENAEVLRWRGMARYFINQKEEAIRDFTKAMNMGDEDAQHILLTKFKSLKI